jgi:hypothetical protein
MSISVSLGPNPFLQFTDNSGKYLPFGQLYTYDWNTREPKATYQDAAGLVPYSNPIQSDSIGRYREIFWNEDAAYYLELRDQNDKFIRSSRAPYTPGDGGGSVITTGIEFENLFINGQFRFFPIGTYEPLPGTINNLADGGWSFRKDGTNPDDSLTFTKYTPDDTTVPASPIYFIHYVATQPGTSETYKDIIYTINDVRSLNNEQITVAVNARSFIAGTYPIEIKAIQNFGTGGSPSASVVTDIVTITPTTSAQTYTGTVTLPDLVGKTLGTNGDDKLEIIFRVPLNSNADLALVNFYLKRGDAVTDYPYETYSQVDAIIKALEIPDHARTTAFDDDKTTYPSEEAYDCIALLPNEGILIPSWLPPVPVGSGMFWFLETAPVGWILAEGQELLKVGQYSRLYNTWNGRYGQPLNNTSASNAGNVIQLLVTTKGAVTPASAGSTIFTFERITQGFDNSGIQGNGASGATFNFINTANGAFTPPATTNTGMTLTITTNGSSSAPAAWSLTGKAASLLTPGTYVSYTTTTGSYYVYLVINGVGTDPALAGQTGHPVNLDSTDTDQVVGGKVSTGIFGQEYTFVTCVSAAQLAPGDYWEVSIISDSYAPWYAIDGAGDAPVVSGKTPLRIDVKGTDTNIQIAQKTADALNPLLFYNLDSRGMFPRFWDHGAGRDPDASSRVPLITGYPNENYPSGDHVGSYQDDNLKSHTHTYTSVGTNGNSGTGQAGGNYVGTNTGATGGNETRPKNFYAALIIKY